MLKYYLLSKGIHAESLAVDWVARNLYWADSMNGQINAVGLDSNSTRTSDLVVILDRDLGQIRSLALMPQKGFESAFIALFLNILSCVFLDGFRSQWTSFFILFSV